MAAGPSIDLSGWLDEQLVQASPDLLRGMVKTFAEALMAAEADAICGAPYGERSDERVNRRNGYRERGWDTRAGSIDLAIPRLRSGSYFPDWLLERQRRAEAALISVVATCYLLGVSTRRMDRLVQTLGITSLSKSQVSDMAKSLDAQVEAFRTRPLDAGPYTFVAADALVLKVREGGRIVNVHALLAVGVNAEGYREILGLQVTSAEDGAGWLGFFRDLVARGLSGVKLVTSDAHRGLVDAIGATLPGAAWRGLAALPHPLRRQPDVRDPEGAMGLGEGAAALGLRPARRRRGARPVRPDRRRALGQAARGRRAPGHRARRHLGVHRLPQGDLAPDLV
jgi:transposase-like protein